MSVTVTSYPVTTSGSNELNLLPANVPINVSFSRQDYAIESIVEDTGFIVVRLDGGTVLSGEFGVGDKLYIYSEGVGYTYDGVGEVTAVTFEPITGGDAVITLDIPYVVDTTLDGYCNYKQDWYLEVSLRDVTLTAVDILGYTLKGVGDRTGVIDIDVSNAVDLLAQDLDLSSREQEEGRVDFLVFYRESWRNNRSEAYTQVAGEAKIIALDAIESVTAQTIANSFTQPKMWKGYPILSCLFNSDTNEAASIVVTFDELDVNKSTLTTANALTSLQGKGVLQALFNNAFVYDADTKYLRFKWGAVATQTVELLEPVSLSDSNLDKYEYFLLWYDVNGGVHSYLFTDFERSQDIDATNVNTDTSNPTRLFESNEQTVTIVAENLNDNEKDVFDNLLRAKKVYRVFKDFTFVNILINESSARKRESGNRFDVLLEIQEQDKKMYK